MKQYKTIHHEYDTKEVDVVVCDICKNKFDENWNRGSSYDTLETQVTLKTGDSFPEGGSGNITSFDICPICFVEKLIPLLNTLGAEPSVTPWGW